MFATDERGKARSLGLGDKPCFRAGSARIRLIHVHTVVCTVPLTLAPPWLYYRILLGLRQHLCVTFNHQTMDLTDRETTVYVELLFASIELLRKGLFAIVHENRD